MVAHFITDPFDAITDSLGRGNGSANKSGSGGFDFHFAKPIPAPQPASSSTEKELYEKMALNNYSSYCDLWKHLLGGL